MHVFHPRLQPFQLTRPKSDWAKKHDEWIKILGSNLLNISDSRSKLINFQSLQNDVERIMGQTCISIEWVNEGGCNQVSLNTNLTGPVHWLWNSTQIYLLTLANGLNLLARLSFPFPHTVRTGEAFAHQEAEDRCRLPRRLQSEVGFENSAFSLSTFIRLVRLGISRRTQIYRLPLSMPLIKTLIMLLAYPILFSKL